MVVSGITAGPDRFIHTHTDYTRGSKKDVARRAARGLFLGVARVRGEAARSPTRLSIRRSPGCCITLFLRARGPDGPFFSPFAACGRAYRQRIAIIHSHARKARARGNNRRYGSRTMSTPGFFGPRKMLLRVGKDAAMVWVCVYVWRI